MVFIQYMLRVSTNFWPKVHRKEILFWESKPLGWWEKKCKDFLLDINQRKSLGSLLASRRHHSCIFFSPLTISVPLVCLWAHPIWWSHKICMLTLKSKPYMLRKEKGRKRERGERERGGEGETSHVTYRFMSCHLHDEFLLEMLSSEMPKPKPMPKKESF